MTVDSRVHGDIIKRFGRLEATGRLAHAYLFIGPKGIGKAETAYVIAQLLQCDDPQARAQGRPCDECPSCKKIASGNHPDVHRIESGYGESLKIEQVRELLDQIKLRPFMGNKKIFIVRDVEKLTIEAANAFLKTLEEPTTGSVLLLTTSAAEKNLGTIRSRCHAVFFPLLPQKVVVRQLEQEYHQDADVAHFLAAFSEGCLGQARSLQESALFVRKNQIIDSFILRGDDTLIKKLVEEKAQTREFLGVVLSWVRDCMVAKSGGDMIVNRDRIAEITRCAQRYTVDELYELYADVTQACRLLAENLNVKIPLILLKEKMRYE